MDIDMDKHTPRLKKDLSTVKQICQSKSHVYTWCRHDHAHLGHLNICVHGMLHLHEGGEGRGGAVIYNCELMVVGRWPFVHRKGWERSTGAADIGDLGG